MRNFTKMKSWLLLMMMGLMFSASSAFADTDEISGDVVCNNKYLAEATTDLEFNLTFVSFDWEWGQQLYLTFPAGFTVTSAGQVNGHDAVITGQEVFWQMNYYNSSGTVIDVDFTVSVDVTGLAGNQMVAYTVNGDGYGGAPHTFSGNAVVGESVPKLGINPVALDLGEWPIGGWQEMAYLELFNDGTGDVVVTASDLDDVNGVFGIMNPNLPLTLPEGGAPTMVGIEFTGAGVAEGVYNATYVASWGAGKSVTTADIMATAYAAPVGDIVENPFMVTLPVAEVGVSTAMPMRSNYILPGATANGKDVVYKFELTEDQEVTFDITNATEAPKMAVYAADFGGVGGPSITNAVVSGGAAIAATPLYTGTYYVVVSCEAADAAMTFDFNITGTTMPSPEKAFNPSPADGEMDVLNPVTLTWEFGLYTNEYKLVYGTTYPPSTVLVDWTSDLATSYDLGNLDPSMQYFWRVDVKNNNGMTDGDNWGFTTTITPPANLTATVVYVADDEYNVDLNWTASAKALLSYNVYRDGAFLGTTNAGVNTYTDLDPAYNMNPCYEYTVEAVFDEGVSDLSNTASACITGVGTVDGTVTELLNGSPIDGATVTLTSTTGGTDYTFTTDFMGMYSGEVLEDNYDYRVTKDGFIPADLLGVDIAYNTTVSNDFQLDEFPYPVSGVIASEVADNQVQVDWSGNSGGGISQWLIYDTGEDNDLNLGTSSPFTIEWGHKFPADQLVDVPGCKITKVAFWKNDAYVANTYVVKIYEGDAAGTELYSEDITSQVVDGWAEYTLAAAVPFDNTQTLWITVYNDAGAAQYVSPMAPALPGITNSDFYSFNGGAWSQTAGLGYGGEAWMLRGFATDAAGKSVSLGTPFTEYKDRSGSNATLQAVAGSETPSAYPTYAVKGEKSLMGYNVYRQDCAGTEPMEFLGYTLDEMFTDNNWGDVDWGTYRWAVEAVYTNNASEPAYSNCLDKDMVAVVNVEVTTNSGDLPEGCEVVFTNTSEPDLALIYELTLDATGMATIDPFRKGTYDITVTLAGFTPLAFTGELVDADRTFVWVLDELLLPPSDLYVTPTGFATWGGSGVAPFEPFMENFDTQDQFDMWEVIDGGSTTDTWHWVSDYNGNTIDGTGFAFVNSDAAGSGSNSDEIMASPVIDASMVSELYVGFDIVHQQIGDYMNIDVFDGSDWVTVGTSDSDSGPFPWGDAIHMDFDVSAYANADFRVRFEYVAGWDWYIGIDNVTVTDGSGKYSDKGFQFYKVFSDDVFIVDRDTNFYQYGDNGEVLVPGETYHACVSSLYSTGLSAETCYDWTYLPCDSFPGYNQMDAYNVDGSDDVLVVWSDMVPMELVTVTQNPGDPANGYYQAYGMGYGVAYDFSSYPDALVNSVDFHHASWGVTGTWNYNIHIVDWDTKTVLATVGPLTTTVNDDWEMGAELGDISTNGAATVAILMEPLSNDPADAYPDISSDNDTDPQGSVFGDLSDLAGFGASGIGNFLMNVTIYTANSGKSAPVVMNVNQAPAAQARVANDYTFNPTQVINQTEISAKSDKLVESLGANVYRDGEMIAFVAAPDTFYMDMDLMPGYYDYCVAQVYTEDAGEHTWTSCTDANCVEDVLLPEDCLAPMNLTAEDLIGDGFTATLNWDAPVGPASEWLLYDNDNLTYAGIGAEAADYSIVWAVKFVPEDLTDYTTGFVTKIAVNQAAAAGDYVTEVRILSGDGTTILGSQDVTGTLVEGWNEIELTSAVEFDNTENLWIAMYAERAGGTYNEPTSTVNSVMTDRYDFFAYNGAAWTSISGEYGITDQGFMLRGFVSTSANGKSVSLGHVDNGNYTNYTESIPTGLGMIKIDPNYEYTPFNAKGTNEFLGYNVYRDGDADPLNAAPLTETTYLDVMDASEYHCYEVKGVYSVCGESDPTNEACVTVGVGVNELDNQVSVYPNPAQDYVMVEANSNIRSIVITNYMGQVVSSNKSVELTQTRIETSSLSAGVYFVEVETAAGIEKVRVIISK